MKMYTPAPSTHAPERLWQFAGLKSDDGVQLIEQIYDGLDGEVADRIILWSNISKVELRQITGIPSTTFNRSLKSGFNAEQSERLVRFIRVMDRAVELFEGDKVAAQNWLYKPVRGLNWKKPAELLASETGAVEVMRLINRLEHGVFS